MAQLRLITLCGKIEIVEKWITYVDKKLVFIEDLK